MNRIIISTILLLGLIFGQKSEMSARERVYVSTDKEYYLSGENIWCSVYCLDDASGRFSSLSSVAYLDFHTGEGLVTTFKVALVEGRGCAKFEVPFSFKTGNYSIVAYTKRDGGDSEGEFNGKIVTVFNTLTNEKVKGGVKVVESLRAPEKSGVPSNAGEAVSVTLERSDLSGDDLASLKLTNLSDGALSLNVSVYSRDGLEAQLGRGAYDRSLLLERTGDFASTGILEYEGEVIRGKIVPKDAASKDAAPGVSGRKVYMSAIGGTDDVYTAVSDADGEVVFYTDNIYGNRELVFEVEGSDGLRVEVQNDKYEHRPKDIPVLEISYDLNRSLQERGLNMQISKRFESDTLYELYPMRVSPLLADRECIRYRLEDYTKFPTIEEVVREYVVGLRLRKVGEDMEFQLETGRAFVLLDGVPILDHDLLLNLDPHLVEELVLYQRPYAIGGFVYNGIVLFRTYKGDLGGLRLGDAAGLVNHSGTAYPLALLGGRIYGNAKYPNYNGTIYWNPIVELEPGGTYEFNCALPKYKGTFNVVIEGLDSHGRSIRHSAEFSNE